MTMSLNNYTYIKVIVDYYFIFDKLIVCEFFQEKFTNAILYSFLSNA